MGQTLMLAPTRAAARTQGPLFASCAAWLTSTCIYKRVREALRGAGTASVGTEHV